MAEHARKHPPSILVAEDDPDDRELLAEAFSHIGFDGSLAFVRDGRELLDHLLGSAETPAAPLPQLVLLDLNMPRIDGREALVLLRTNEATRALPVVVLTTSRADHDIVDCFARGASSYCSKPLDFSGLIALAGEIDRWWFKASRVPDLGH